MNYNKVLTEMINDEQFKLKYLNIMHNRADTIPTRKFYHDECMKTLKRLNALFYARWISQKSKAVSQQAIACENKELYDFDRSRA